MRDNGLVLGARSIAEENLRIAEWFNLSPKEQAEIRCKHPEWFEECTTEATPLERGVALEWMG